jgi:hypothetical protein
MELLPTLVLRLGWFFKGSFISGLAASRKGRSPALPPEVAGSTLRFGRDFAVVAAQKPRPRRIAFSI